MIKRVGNKCLGLGLVFQLQCFCYGVRRTAVTEPRVCCSVKNPYFSISHDLMV